MGKEIILEQMANIGSEVYRAINWRKRVMKSMHKWHLLGL